MQVVPTKLSDVKILRPSVFSDARGFFRETWNRRDFAAAGIDVDFVQDNHSHSTRGTLRGLHYQNPNAQGKLVWAGHGTVYDVSVDLRRSSASFGQWVGVTLSDENRDMLWIPPGFAHGFVVLSESADCFYKCTDYYAPAHERSILWNDPDLNIEWPLPPDTEPLVSARDQAAVAFAAADTFP
jgi:dTDP-4-dehydrorhamnose 3,5-epimerase